MKNEKGRTMPEIIAILAIVGILSVTGGWWYFSALRQQKVDEIFK